MPEHVVKLGECLESIAFLHGFTWESLWNLEGNADLKRLRENPNLLFPGDCVHIPELQEHQDPAGTESLHKYKKKNSISQLHLQLLENGQPIANQPFQLLFDDHKKTGWTDADGNIQVSISPAIRQVKLVLPDLGKNFFLELGQLGPIQEVSGCQARLHNLGYYQGKIDGIDGPATSKALSSFQRDNDLEDTGAVNEQTLNKLQEAHGI